MKRMFFGIFGFVLIGMALHLSQNQQGTETPAELADTESVIEQMELAASQCDGGFAKVNGRHMCVDAEGNPTRSPSAPAPR